MRDNFRKALRARQTKSGQATAKKKTCKFEDMLSFLLPFLTDRKVTSNIVIVEAGAEEEEVPAGNRPTAVTEPTPQDDYETNNNPPYRPSSASSRTSL